MAITPDQIKTRLMNRVVHSSFGVRNKHQAYIYIYTEAQLFVLFTLFDSGNHLGIGANDKTHPCLTVGLSG